MYCIDTSSHSHQNGADDILMTLPLKELEEQILSVMKNTEEPVIGGKPTEPPGAP